MIGNITIAGDMNELQNLIAIRTQFLTSYISNCKSRGIPFEPHKMKIVVINDTDSCGDDYIVGSILLPNSRAIFSLIEGDYNTFVQEYYNKLESDPDVQEYIIVLLAGLVERGFDYVFYFDSNDPSIYTPIANTLMQYLNQKFGVVAAFTPTVLMRPDLFLSSSIAPQYITNIQNLIQQYKLSNKPASLFVQY